ncbi:uncharacterized protein BP01DRAFT_302482 [Aspergillus saccharolyticus JOP 1030-1]|uniref:Uncharacterized protein n=1 Tax=Aspergillus saccharolyticus JOP 1030-1 TaxID=1450539 RepID=A0A318Z8H1_9EURO|nr:hypothetical protein BP01DRAFT_302482 [Aspergillus saccharolyticus JOP 1030-1]PYH42694.1 hypothetical protein BP01DRAFT_302482 [Aspergillus saccharolyticus JOP 1030-1]
MVRLFQNGLASGLMAYAFYQQALSVELAEIDSYETATNTLEKVAVSGSTTSTSTSSLDLQNQHSFYWGAIIVGGETDVLGNFTVAMLESYETVLAMEAFKDLVQNVTCTNGTSASVTVAFSDSASYTYAKSAWSWLNEADPHYVLLVAGAGQCGWNTARQPFIMTGASFRDNVNTARFTGNVTEWQNSVSEFSLRIAKAETDDQIAIAKRGTTKKRGTGTKDSTIDIAKDFSFSDKSLFDKDSASLSAGCSTCKTSGKFDMVFEYSTSVLSLLGSEKASVTLTPSNVSAYLEPQLQLSGNLTKSEADEVDLVTIPIDGISIAKIATIGPMVKIALGWSVGPLDGEATIGMGVEIDVSDSAKAELSFDQSAKNEFSFDQSGWSPTVTTKDFTLDAKLEANVEIYGKVSVEIEFDILGYGWEGGIYLQPYVGADLALEASSQGVCSADSADYHYAVEVTPSAGVNLVADVASASDEANPITSWDIASIATTLSEKCFGFDKVTSTSTSTTTTKTSETSSQTTSSKASSSQTTSSKASSSQTTSSKASSSKASSSKASSSKASSSKASSSKQASSSHAANSATSKAHPSSAAAHATSTSTAYTTSTHTSSHSVTITPSPSHKSRRNIMGGHGRRKY